MKIKLTYDPKNKVPTHTGEMRRDAKGKERFYIVPMTYGQRVLAARELIKFNHQANGHMPPNIAY